MKNSITLTNAQAWLLLDLVQEETTRIEAKTGTAPSKQTG